MVPETLFQCLEGIERWGPALPDGLLDLVETAVLHVDRPHTVSATFLQGEKDEAWRRIEKYGKGRRYTASLEGRGAELGGEGCAHHGTA